MRFRLWLNVLASLTITSVAFASGGEKLYVPPTPTGNGMSESSSSNNGILTPRQQAEHKYGDAYDGIAKAKEDAAAGKQKNADKRFKRALADCQEAVAIDSTYHEAWNLIGFASRKLGDYPHSLAAYRVNRETGDIDYASDRGVTSGSYPTQFRITNAEKELTSVVFPCVATCIYDLVDQQALKTLSTITVFDGVNNGEPRQYGYTLSKPEPGVSYVEDTAVLFARRGNEFKGAGVQASANADDPTNKLRQFKIVMGSGPAATRFLLINSTAKNPEGEGYVMGAGGNDQGVAAVTSGMTRMRA